MVKMIKRWKDHPRLWKELYDSYSTSSLEEAGFSGIREIKLEVIDPPAVLRSLEGFVQEFWSEFTAAQPKARNEPKYGFQQGYMEKIGAALIVRVFPTDYAAIRFKNSRDEKFDSQLTSEQQYFLQQLVTPGVQAYLARGDNYLMGTRADGGARAGLTENVPAGLLNPPDNFEAALTRELHEETGLHLELDIVKNELTHINYGPKYGDHGLIFRMNASLQARDKVRANPAEHSGLLWMDSRTIREKLQTNPYFFNPVTAALFEKLLEDS